MSDQTWSIGELAEEFNTTLRTIRFYEDRGLLTPQRQGTARIFHDRDRVRLQLILRGKRLGFTLDEIAHVLAKRRDLDEALTELDDLEKRCRADLKRLSEPG
jgi:DNA-binding transcriptional MerR regulator